MITSPVSVGTLQAFFLEAAAATYAAKAPKSTIIELPGSKVYRYEREGLSYTDVYYTNGEYSGGQTVILADNVPVWIMQYQGWCKDDDPEVVAFLKRALMKAYSEGQFHLGRGPVSYNEEEPRASSDGRRALNSPLIYECLPNLHGPTEFDDFAGQERVFRFPHRPETLFYHRFQGMLLRDAEPGKHLVQLWK